MRTQAFMLLLSGAIGLTISGCASSPIMRGQSPQACWDGGSSHGDCPMCNSGYSAGSCQSGSCRGGACQGNCNLPFHPVHRNSYTYSTPDGLMYPPEEAPAAMYQYPYYTFRGPTDFFMK
ncbi:MAG: hypothetical protein R3C19_13130 [Planctomycetaceae bacterium]